MEPLHVGDLLVGLLVAHGVDTVFGLPGGQTAALYDGIDRHQGTRSVTSGCVTSDPPRTKPMPTPASRARSASVTRPPGLARPSFRPGWARR